MDPRKAYTPWEKENKDDNRWTLNPEQPTWYFSQSSFFKVWQSFQPEIKKMSHISGSTVSYAILTSARNALLNKRRNIVKIVKSKFSRPVKPIICINVFPTWSYLLVPVLRFNGFHWSHIYIHMGGIYGWYTSTTCLPLSSLQLWNISVTKIKLNMYFFLTTESMHLTTGKTIICQNIDISMQW